MISCEATLTKLGTLPEQLLYSFAFLVELTSRAKAQQFFMLLQLKLKKIVKESDRFVSVFFLGIWVGFGVFSRVSKSPYTTARHRLPVLTLPTNIIKNRTFLPYIPASRLHWLGSSRWHLNRPKRPLGFGSSRRTPPEDFLNKHWYSAKENTIV